MSYRTPTPGIDYLAMLGRAAYTWAYTEWMLLYVIKWGSQQDLADHVGGTGGKIVNSFKAVVDANNSAPLADLVSARRAAAELLKLNDRRNDILHARPATIAGQQVLLRWAPKSPKASEGPIHTADLERFVRELEAARDSISPLFEHLRK